MSITQDNTDLDTPHTTRAIDASMDGAVAVLSMKLAPYNLMDRAMNE